MQNALGPRLARLHVALQLIQEIREAGGEIAICGQHLGCIHVFGVDPIRAVAVLREVLPELLAYLTSEKGMKS